MSSPTFVIPSAYAETFDKNINHFKELLKIANESKETIVNSKINKKSRDKAKDIITINTLIAHNDAMVKMYNLEKMLFKMILTPPKDNFTKIITNMREKFYDAASNAMDTYKDLVELDIKDEQGYILICNQFKKRMKRMRPVKNANRF